MKWIILFSLITFSFSALSWEAREEWNTNLNQEMLLNCDQGDTVCLKTCGDEFQCRIQAGFCKNCVGTGLLLSYFYQEVGRWFVSSPEKISEDDFALMLKKQNFVLLTADSPYNIFTPIRDPLTDRAFNSLCPSKLDSFSVVVGTLTGKKELGSISAVICHGENGAEIFKMKSSPNVEMIMMRLKILST